MHVLLYTCPMSFRFDITKATQVVIGIRREGGVMNIMKMIKLVLSLQPQLSTAACQGWTFLVCGGAPNFSFKWLNHQ